MIRITEVRWNHRVLWHHRVPQGSPDQHSEYTTVIQLTTEMTCCFAVPFHGSMLTVMKEHISQSTPRGALLVCANSFLLFIIQNCQHICSIEKVEDRITTASIHFLLPTKRLKAGLAHITPTTPRWGLHRKHAHNEDTRSKDNFALVFRKKAWSQVDKVHQPPGVASTVHMHTTMNNHLGSYQTTVDSCLGGLFGKLAAAPHCKWGSCRLEQHSRSPATLQ